LHEWALQGTGPVTVLPGRAAARTPAADRRRRFALPWHPWPVTLLPRPTARPTP